MPPHLRDVVRCYESEEQARHRARIQTCQDLHLNHQPWLWTEETQLMKGAEMPKEVADS